MNTFDMTALATHHAPFHIQMRRDDPEAECSPLMAFYRGHDTLMIASASAVEMNSEDVITALSTIAAGLAADVVVALFDSIAPVSDLDPATGLAWGYDGLVDFTAYLTEHGCPRSGVVTSALMTVAMSASETAMVITPYDTCAVRTISFGTSYLVTRTEPVNPFYARLMRQFTMTMQAVATKAATAPDLSSVITHLGLDSARDVMDALTAKAVMTAFPKVTLSFPIVPGTPRETAMALVMGMPAAVIDLDPMEDSGYDCNHLN